MAEKTVIMDAQAIGRAITRISFEIVERNRGAEDLCLIGIRSGGAVLARRIADRIGEIENRPVECGELDITLFRDDGSAPEGYEDHSRLDFSIDGKRVVLIDDVIYTGRSVRAAIDAIIEHGDAPGTSSWRSWWTGVTGSCRSAADFIGKNLPTSKEEMVEVQADGGPEDCVAIVK